MTIRALRGLRSAVVGLAVVLVFLLSAEVAAANTVDIVVDSTEIKVDKKADGTFSGKFTIMNVSDATVTVTPTVASGCRATLDPAALDAGRRSEVLLTLSSGCSLDKGTELTLSFPTGTSPPSVSVAVSEKKQTTVDWTHLLKYALAGIVIALLALIYPLVKKHQRNEQLTSTASDLYKNLAERRKTEEEKITDAFQKRGLGTPKANPQTLQEEHKIGLRTELKGLSTDWSFKDNWVSNITLGSAAIVTLLGTSGVLKAILGSEPEAVLGLLAVAGAIAALLVAIGPLILKMIGKRAGTPTIWGMLLAATVTLSATMFLIVAVGWEAYDLTAGGARFFVLGVTTFVVFVVFWYSTKSLRGYVVEDVGAKDTPPSPNERSAWVIAQELGHGKLLTRTPSPLDIDEIVAANKDRIPQPGSGIKEEDVRKAQMLPEQRRIPSRNALL